MSENTANLYQAPESNLNEPQSGRKPILEFERFTAWAVFFLAIFTFGIYSAYWLVSRTKQANSLAKNQVNINLVYGYIGLVVAQLVFAFAAPESLLGSLVSLASFVVLLIVVFTLRTSLTELINEGSEEPVKLGPILTFFFNIIYFQYKINEAIDKQR